jgi:phosphoglycerate dehydrogenase-like enzyme
MPPRDRLRITSTTLVIVEALQKRVIAGAGLDVVDGRRGLPNVIITPSVATASDAGNENYWLLARENLRR